MKTKFSVEIHSKGDANESLIRMITNHNSGMVKIDLNLLVAHCHARYAQYPTITPETETIENIGNRQLDIKENGIHTLTISEKEIYELVTETEADLITAENAS